MMNRFADCLFLEMSRPKKKKKKRRKGRKDIVKKKSKNY